MARLDEGVVRHLRDAGMSHTSAGSQHRVRHFPIRICLGAGALLLTPLLSWAVLWWPTWIDQRTAARLEKLPGVVFFRREEGSPLKIPFVPERPGLEWIHNLRPPTHTRTNIHIDRRFPANELGTLSGLAQVDWVAVRGLPLGRWDVALVSRLPGLRTLELFGGIVDDQALSGYAGAGVMSISLRDSSITDAGVEYLRVCDSMRTLNLSGTRVRKPAVDRMGWSADTSNVLKLARTEIGDDALDAVAKIPHLFFLDIRETRVTDVGLAKLARVYSLKCLLASDTHVGNAGVKGILSGRRPDYFWPILDLARTRVTSAGLMPLDVNVTHLSIAGTDCGNELVPWLVARPNLDELDLSDTRLDDQGLDCLTACPRLAKLRIAKCPVTEAGVIEFLVSSRTVHSFANDGSTAKAAPPFVPGVGEILPDGAIRRSASGLGIYPPWITEALWKFHGTGELYRPLEPSSPGRDSL